VAKIIGGIFAVLVSLVTVAWYMRPFYMGHIRAWMWDGSSTFVCEGNDSLSMKNKTAKIGDGPAIELRDNCQLSCTDCTLEGEIAVVASGNAKLELTGGSLVGTEAAIEMRSNAKLEATKTAMRGPVGIDGADSNAGAKLTEITLEATRLGAKLGGNADFELRDSTIKAPLGIEAGSNARVTMRGGLLEAKTRAIQLSSNARVSVKQKGQVKGEVVEGRPGSFEKSEP
jgi:hypothetical protein